MRYFKDKIEKGYGIDLLCQQLLRTNSKNSRHNKSSHLTNLVEPAFRWIDQCQLYDFRKGSVIISQKWIF